MTEQRPTRMTNWHIWQRAFDQEARNSLTDLFLPIQYTLSAAGDALTYALRIR